MKVILRRFNPDSDTGLIYDSYPKGVWVKSVKSIMEPKKEWMGKFFEKMQEQLRDCDVHIACLESDHDQIMGYSIIDGRELQFVYVKEAYRRKRIGSLLTRGKFDTLNPETLTFIGEEIYGRTKTSPAEINEQREDKSDDGPVDRSEIREVPCGSE